MLKEREAAMQILKEKNLTEQQFAHFRDYFDLQETEGNASIFSPILSKKKNTVQDFVDLFQSQYCSSHELVFYENLTFHNFPGELLVALALTEKTKLPYVTKLALYNCNIRNTQFFTQLLALNPEITKFNFSFNREIQNEGFNEILQNIGGKIEELQVVDIQVTIIPPTLIKLCSNIRFLNLSRNVIENSGFDTILYILKDTLSELDVSRCGITRINSSILSNCMRLKHLDLSLNIIGNNGLHSVFSSLFDRIEELNVLKCGVTYFQVDLASKCEKLKNLWISYHQSIELKDSLSRSIRKGMVSLETINKEFVIEDDITRLIKFTNSWRFKVGSLLLARRICNYCDSWFYLLPKEIVIMIISNFQKD